MRILVVTNLYPPHYLGGYELGCQDVVEGLRVRGHLVHVITGKLRFGRDTLPAGEATIDRVLSVSLGNKLSRETHWEDCRQFRVILKRFKPEIVYFWNQAGLCLWLPFIARFLRYRIAFFLSDTNFISWRVASWGGALGLNNRVTKALFKKTFLWTGIPVVQNHACHFASHFLYEQAINNRLKFSRVNSTVIHWGIDPSRYTAMQDRWPLKCLLYVGQLIPEKGVHTAIRAFGALCSDKSCGDYKFTIVGGGTSARYEKEIRSLVANLSLSDNVQFIGKVPRDRLAEIYSKCDILIFPSEWDEPFAITPLEAITCGLIVVGTTTGGSAELLRNRETAMTFKAGDAIECAHLVSELNNNRALADHIRMTSVHEVSTKFTLQGMIDKIESSLQKLTTSPTS